MMRVLLDECLPRKLKNDLSGHDVSTVPEATWAGKKNGELLELAAGQFDVFITSDQNLVYQQRLQTAKIAVVVLVTKNNRLESFQRLLPKVHGLLKKAHLEGIHIVE